MKLTFFENEHYTDIQLTLETPEETAQLLRFTKSSKREVPSVFFSFSNTPYCNISFAKKRIEVQHNSINNSKSPNT